MNTHILRKPVITEKSMRQATDNIYTFEVDLKATKHQIKQVVADTFSVDVLRVTTTIRKPSTKRTGKKKMASLTSATKIARVWLKSGQTIDLFEFKKD